MADNPIPEGYVVIARQTNWGVWLILLPSIAIIVGLPMAMIAIAEKLHPVLSLGVGFVISIPLAWAFWSVTVGHWFLHALSRTPQDYWLELYQTAVSKQLLWPLESRYNKTIVVLPKYADLWDYSLITIVEQQRSLIQRTLLKTLPDVTFLSINRTRAILDTTFRVFVFVTMAAAALSSEVWVPACAILLVIYPYTTTARRRLLQAFRGRRDGLYVSGWGIYSNDARGIYLPWYKVRQLEYVDSQQQIKVWYGTNAGTYVKVIFCGDYQDLNYRWFKNLLVAYWHYRHVAPPVLL